MYDLSEAIIELFVGIELGFELYLSVCPVSVVLPTVIPFLNTCPIMDF